MSTVFSFTVIPIKQGEAVTIYRATLDVDWDIHKEQYDAAKSTVKYADEKTPLLAIAKLCKRLHDE